jgi:hypothetical protein
MRLYILSFLISCVSKKEASGGFVMHNIAYVAAVTSERR